MASSIKDHGFSKYDHHTWKESEWKIENLTKHTANRIIQLNEVLVKTVEHMEAQNTRIGALEKALMDIEKKLIVLESIKNPRIKNLEI